ncbi:MAG: DUF3990 domain-containing protein [Bacteroidales bacterium]|nr:DUF3990 domain-containing protein [Candidatus Physcocola equi]
MRLYHGSDILIDKIDFEKSKPFKDFGKGFYLSAEYDQAMDMAKQRIRQKKGIGTPIVTTFEFDESVMKGNDLKVKIWEDYSVDWVKFIIRNRDRKQPFPWHDFDIVYGPIADDGVSFQLRRYEAGYLSIEQLVEELKYAEGITFQYYFANEKAIAKLTRICD